VVRVFAEVLRYLKEEGLRSRSCVQTISEPPGDMAERALVRSGRGEGLFAVARGQKPPVGAQAAGG
jgi:hypothetical protein